MDKPKILPEEEIKKELAGLPGWEREGMKIKKQFKFQDFADSLNFINGLLPYCEELDHHPDAHIFYSKVLFELTRYDVGEKLTDKDFAIARKIEELYAEKNR